MLTVQGFDPAEQMLLGLKISTTSQRVGKALERSAELVLAYMQRSKLSGQVLRVRTGKLRSNWIVGRAAVVGDAVAVAVGTNTRYAPAQNYGFTGPEWVRSHVRSRPKSRRGSTPRSQKRRLRARSEARAARADRQRREKDSLAAHGMGLGELQRTRLGERRARGIQQGVGEASAAALAKAAEGGGIVVRAHGRYMKLRGKRFVESSLREREQAAAALFWHDVLRGVRR